MFMKFNGEFLCVKVHNKPKPRKKELDIDIVELLKSLVDDISTTNEEIKLQPIQNSHFTLADDVNTTNEEIKIATRMTKFKFHTQTDLHI